MVVFAPHTCVGPSDVRQRHKTPRPSVLYCARTLWRLSFPEIFCARTLFGASCGSRRLISTAGPYSVVGKNDRNTSVFTFRTKTLQTMKTRALEDLKPKNCFSLKNAGIWERKTRHFGGRYIVSILPGSLRRDVCHSDFYIDDRTADVQPKQAKSSDAI